jgi:hypothetical protein
VEFRAYPVGSLVKVKRRKKRPSNWNEEMFDHIQGQTAEIWRNGNCDVLDDKDYMYKLKGWQWTWRHMDLELISVGRPDPNIAFRIKKHGAR